MIPPITEWWGKARLDPLTGRVSAWHPLADHCLDVATVFRRLSTLPHFKRVLDRAAGAELTSLQLERISVFALLHDIGKFNRGFQAKLIPGVRFAGHVREAAGFFSRGDDAADTIEFRRLTEWFNAGDEAVARLLLAAISHHGTPLVFDDLFDHRKQGLYASWWMPAHDDPLAGVRALMGVAKRGFPEAFSAGTALDVSPALQHRFAGFLMLADWIASDTRFFPYRVNADEDRLRVAEAGCSRALAAVGLDVARPRTLLQGRDPTFDDVFGFAPYPLQVLLSEELPVDESTRVLLVESETGSGKTEAALAWFLRLFREDAVAGLYFALPTRVAARELYERVVGAIRSAFPDAASRLSPVLLAVPGYAKVDGELPVLAPASGNLWTDDPGDERREHAWASEHPKRFLAAPVAVGTIDQALMSILQTRHAHLRSACLDRSLLVVDEVHASDPYMRSLLAVLNRHHTDAGGRVLLLSATLGEAGRALLLRHPPAPLPEAESRPYPAASTLRYIATLPRRSGRNVRVSFIDGLDDWEGHVRVIAASLCEGARVLVVLNTVSRANRMLRELEACPSVDRAALFSVNGVGCPHHGRFAREDRLILDRAVSERLGPRSAQGPVVLVGTQTLEQSLDIDADLLITDHCPMDVLLQRIGRLHRHRRERRPAAHASAHCIVLSVVGNRLEEFLRARTGEGRGPAGIGTVYDDLRVLKLTRAVIESASVIRIPDDNRRLVESATHPHALAALPATWSAHARFIEGQVMAQCRQAELAAIETLPFGDFRFQPLGERVATRLGLGDRAVRFPGELRTPFGSAVNSLNVPAHLARGLDESVSPAEVEQRDDGFRFSLGERQYDYSRFGLEARQPDVRPA